MLNNIKKQLSTAIDGVLVERMLESYIEIKQKTSDTDVVNFTNQIIDAGCEDLVYFNSIATKTMKKLNYY